MYAQSQPEVFVVGTQEFNEAGQAIGLWLGFWEKVKLGEILSIFFMEKGSLTGVYALWMSMLQVRVSSKGECKHY